MKNLDAINNLLENARKICLTYKNEEEKPEPFNIFRALGIERREVPLCRVFAELINPSAHDLGAKFLEIFCNQILGYTENVDYAKAVVRPEFPILVPQKSAKEKNRRIDIHIQLENGIQIPIEAKIDAGDQECQLTDYYWFCENKINGEIRRIYYLTLDGHEPAESSKGELEKDQYACISFAFHILRWIKLCLSECSLYSSVRNVLLQLQKILQENTNIERQKKAMEASKLINSAENFEAAAAIAEGLLQKKKDVMVSFFDQLEMQLKEQLPDYEIIGRYKDYAEAYYEQKTSTWPGIVIPLRKNEEPAPFALRIEIDYQLYFGVCNYCENSPYCNDDTCKNAGILAKEKQDYVQEKLTPRGVSNNASKAFYWWQYLPDRTADKDNKSNIDFRKCNDEYKKLYSVDGIQAAVKKVSSAVVSCIKDIELL